MEFIEGPDWESFKPEIERLYLKENKPLKELIRTLAGLGFAKTKSQYERKFKEWNFKKNRKGTDWRAISQKIEKRKKANRETKIYIDGILCPPSKVAKEISRHGNIPFIERYLEESSPPTPEGVVICSRSPSPLRQEYNLDFPWFNFLREMRPLLNQVNQLRFSQSGMLSLFRSTQICEFDSLGRLMKSEGIQPTVPNIACFLHKIMPEAYLGKGLNIKSVLAPYDNGPSMIQRFMIELFLLSNNTTRIEADMDSYRTQMMRLLEKAVPGGLGYLQHLPEMARIAALSITEKIFASAVTASDLRTTRILLEAGMPTNTRIFNLWGFEAIPPLCAAANIGNERAAIDMTNLLLPYITNVNHSFNEMSPLCYACKRKHRRVARILLEHGVDPTPLALKFAIEMRDIQLVKSLLDSNINVNEKLPKYQRPNTLLGTAVHTGNLEIIEILLEKGADMQIITDFTFDQLGYYTRSITTPLGIAAGTGNLPTIRFLLNAFKDCSINHYGGGNSYCPPLALAVGNMSLEGVKLLIDAGADVDQADKAGDMTLVQRALEKILIVGEQKTLELCRTILAVGATANLPPRKSCARDQFWPLLDPPLFTAISENQIRISRLLLDYGAHVNEKYGAWRRTPLGEAIQTGNCELIDLIWRAGGRNLGAAISRIGNIQTALHLYQLGVLPEILNTCGVDILGAAISSTQGELIDYLLKLDMIPLGKDGHVCNPLQEVVLSGNLRLVEYLLARGAHLNDEVLSIAVCRASHTGSYGIIQRLLQHDSTSGLDAPTAFFIAVMRKNHVLLQMLLEAGLQPIRSVDYHECPFCGEEGKKIWESYPLFSGCDTPDNSSALTAAAFTGEGPVLQKLLQAARFEPTDVGSALIYAITEEHYHIVRYLLDAGPELNTPYTSAGELIEETATPLLAAVSNGEVSLINDLLEAGANVNYLPCNVCIDRPYMTKKYRTPLQKAVEIGNSEVIDLLIKREADVNAPAVLEAGATALQLAAIKGYLPIAKKLIDIGAEVNGQRAKIRGRTALEGAAEHGRLDMLYLLLNRGASITGDGRIQYIRAIKFAEEQGFTAAAMLLKSHGGWTARDIDVYKQEDLTGDYYTDNFTYKREHEE